MNYCTVLIFDHELLPLHLIRKIYVNPPSQFHAKAFLFYQLKLKGKISRKSIFVWLFSVYSIIKLHVMNNIFNPFLPDVPFWSPWKHQKTFDFLMFSGGSKEDIGKKRVNKTLLWKILKYLLKLCLIKYKHMLYKNVTSSYFLNSIVKMFLHVFISKV